MHTIHILKGKISKSWCRTFISFKGTCVSTSSKTTPNGWDMLKKSGYSNHLLYMKSYEPWEKNPRLEDTVDDGSEIRLS